MNIKLLGAHNCESQTTKMVSLLIDGRLVVDAGGLTSSLSRAAQQEIKAILLTHQHYDHIRDIPAVAMNFYLAGATINIYSTESVYDALAVRLLDGELYSNLFQRPAENPTVRFTVIKPDQVEQIESYSVMAVAVNHLVPTVGFQVVSADGKVMFYTGDTGPGLAGCWQRVSPQLLIIDVTGTNRFQDFARESRHLTPGLLKRELISFRKLKGYLPRVVTVHMNPELEAEIRDEIAAVAEDLDHPISLGYEGMQISL